MDAEPNDPSLWTDEQTQETVDKVLKRAKVSRITRQLQNRLALANFKSKRGWENLTIDVIEPKLDEDIQKKKAASQDGSESSPGSAIEEFDSNGIPTLRRRNTNTSISYGYPEHRKKRAKTAGLESSQHAIIHGLDGQRQGNRNNVQGQSHSGRHNQPSWKDTHRLPQSSPVYHSFSHHYPQQSVSSIAISPDQDQDQYVAPVQDPFQVQQQQSPPIFHSSPPRTPPHRTIPARPIYQNPSDTSASQQNDKPNQFGQEGADLLLYLASSPSSAQGPKKVVVEAPATPPSRSTPLPSSMLNTPGGNPSTPSTNLFNFHDFVHITPSPAQGPWTGGNPNSGRTPMAMAARRRLNFDGFIPPSPLNGAINIDDIGDNDAITNDGQIRVNGLGMELGGELLSPTGR